MFVRLMWALGIILLLGVVLGLGIYTAYTVRSAAKITPIPTPFPTRIPTPTITTNLTPGATPSAATTFQGVVTGIGQSPVAYKNSTIIAVQETTGTMINVYVNAGTNMTDANNNIIDLPQLSSGMHVIVRGQPIEGGIEASTIKVQSAL